MDFQFGQAVNCLFVSRRSSNIRFLFPFFPVRSAYEWQYSSRATRPSHLPTYLEPFLPSTLPSYSSFSTKRKINRTNNKISFNPAFRPGLNSLFVRSFVRSFLRKQVSPFFNYVTLLINKLLLNPSKKD